MFRTRSVAGTRRLPPMPLRLRCFLFRPLLLVVVLLRLLAVVVRLPVRVLAVAGVVVPISLQPIRTLVAAGGYRL
jgi:hypothetical protein